MLKMLLILVAVFTTHLAHAKVLIVTHAFNRPDFIEYQYRSFKKFLQEDFEFVVYNDALPGKTHNEIKAECAKLGITCIAIPQEIHSHLYPVTLPAAKFFCFPSNRHADGINYALRQLIDYQGTLVLIDSDIFLLRPINFSAFIENADIAAIISPAMDYGIPHPRFAGLPGPHKSIHYFWPGLVIFKWDQLPNKETIDFSPGHALNVTFDTGGYTHFYIANNPQLKINKIDEFFFGLPKNFLSVPLDLPAEEKIKRFEALGYGSKEIDFLLKRTEWMEVEFGYNNHLLHYRGASFEKTYYAKYPFSQDQVNIKSAWIFGYLNQILSD